MSISIDQMRDKLFTLDEVHTRLAASEPLEPHAFPVNAGFAMVIPDDWHQVAGDQVVPDASIRASIDGQDLPITKNGILEAGAHGGIPREHQQQIPSWMLSQEVNWWFQEGLGDKQYKLLKNGEGTVLGITRATINPFSNLAILDTVLEGIAKRYGNTEVLADYKFHHDLENTALRLIIPEKERVITGTRVDGDTWSLGLSYRNSLIGLKPPEMTGYLFRYWCTNGACDTLTTVTAGRRAIKTESEAIEWAAESVDSILGGLEPALDAVQELTSIPVEGDASLVLGDLFTQHNVPRRERLRVLANMADLGGELTMYDVMQATTQAANMEGLSPRSVDILLRTGGHVAHAYTARCDGSLEHGCKRLLPEGYSIPGA